MTELSLGDFFAKIGKGIAAMTARTKSRLIEFRDRRQKESEGDTVDKLFEEQDVAKDAVNEDPVIPVIEDFADIAYSFDQKQQKQDDPSVASEEKENNIQEDPMEDEDTASIPMTATENYEYILPSLDLLAEPAQNSQQHEKSHIQATVRKLDST